MIVIGIDPGSVRTGYGIVRGKEGAFELIDCGIVRLSSRQGIPERIKRIYDELDSLISLHMPERLALETAYVNRNPQSALKLGQVRGAVVALAMNRGIALTEYAPRKVKQVLTGRGGASKEQVSYMARHFLEIEEPLGPYDISDALGIALCDLLIEDRVLPDMKGKRGPASAGRSWSEFVRENPGSVIERFQSKTE